MADYNSSLPVRTETDGDVVSKIVGDSSGNIGEVNANNEQLVHDADGLTKLTDIETNQTDGSQVTKIHDTAGDELGVNDDGSINVNILDTQQGDQIHQYGTAVAGVPNTPVDVVSYTVTALKTFLLKAFQFASSGKSKGELYVGVGVQAVGFISTANGFCEITFPSPIEIPAGTAVKVTVTNKDNANQDLYAFLNGVEVDA